MKDQGIPCEDDVMNPHNAVFSFPMKADSNAVFRDDMTAIEQLEIWKCYAEHWCEHKPSVTISVKEHEWINVGNWCWDNFDALSGISFLPFSDHTYQQAPYQDIDKATYEELASKMPKNINWSELSKFEKEDTTKGAQELACTAGSCELVDI
jgi:ribonucleoside-diphosphate reductase alpha chain